MKTRFRRFVEFTFLVAMYCCSSFFCYEAGLEQAKLTTPVATPGEDPQATEVQPKAAEAQVVEPDSQPIKITPRTTSHQLTIRGQPFLASMIRTRPILPRGPELPFLQQDENPPAPPCGLEPEGDLQRERNNQPLPACVQQPACYYEREPRRGFFGRLFGG